MADDNKTIKLTFAPLDPPKDGKGRERKQSPTVEVANGSYYRKFEAKDAPFEVRGVSHLEDDGQGKEREVVDITPEEELRILMADGNFVVEGENQTAKTETPKKNLGKIGGTQAAESEVRG